ncbi:MAG TPA: hypothetical protein VE954_09810 [Oligoflexus sp.]|uniref:hypothetical protein n=1 Tax=Oligoflexus sp. TaxID=1971216 RepID=UPI002D2379AB|nr:hypothetical protein [Oligoflexus sp.]HYX33397.1 hypothetical protein [Oligoflexus sp.]
MQPFHHSILCIFFLVACGHGSSSSETQPVMDEANQPNTELCSAHNESITTIAGVVALINSLPKPVTLECLVASLKRPLALNATTSVISAQPATSRDKPRIFLQNEGLLLSIVPGDATLEFGEIWQSIYSIKNELTFPIKEPLSDNAPFVSIGSIFSSSQNQTRCGGPCHGTTLEYSKQGGTPSLPRKLCDPIQSSLFPLMS